ncbi:MAG: cyclic nucleotide-binding domain-containing protein [Armatimonadetes bacterium]|nr:cyclic nucleotide-binding domain-containing protein [Anaerolineae bacterium]
MEQAIDLLRQVDLFRGLNAVQLARLAAIAQRETFDADQVVFTQNTPADKLYIVAHGQLEVRVHDENGQGHTAVYLGTGQVVGEMALVDAGTRSATVVAVEAPTEAYSIPNATLLALCESDTAIGYVLMRNLAQDMSFKLRHRSLDPSEAD